MDRRGLLKSFLALRDKYGDVFTVYLGCRPVVVLCGPEAVKEALVKKAEEFSGRGPIAMVDSVFQGQGITFANDHTWKTLRQFSLATLWDFGMGKRSIEERTQEEAQCLVEELQKSQEKVQEEIDQVIGKNRSPELKDRAQMPYTDAVIHEIQRFSDLLPMSIPHCVTQDTSFRGYLIPKGTEVYPLLSTVLHDPKYFEKPYDFDPNHFLDAQGSLKKSEAFIPFSSGKRVCLGEGIARMELFLFLTTILQNFSLRSSMVPASIDLTPRESGVGTVPPIYQLQFLPR
uniref:Cytochrome P450 family 2 subfamily B member 6 n=1 Tax=Sarcophilus harrisii TaxID=9305 RepID=A0A7N4PMY1_SARHA